MTLLRAVLFLASSATAGAASYTSTLNVNSCPADTVPLTEDQCRSHAATATEPSLDFILVEDESTLPKGCYCLTWGDCFFNTHSTGSAQHESYLVCAATTSAPPPVTATTSTLNVNSCPADTVPLTEDQCSSHAATATEPSLDFLGVEDESSWPTGCYCWNGDCYFNTHSTGSAEDESYLVCAATTSTLNVASCPADTVPLTEDQCRSHAASATEPSLFFNGDENAPIYPSGCYCTSSMPFCYFNNHPTGLAQPTDSVVCAATTSAPPPVTSSPTGSPTGSPTSSPTPAGPFELKLLNVTADFSVDSKLSLEYELGVGRTYRATLLKKGCVDPVEDSLYTKISDDTQPIEGKDSFQKLTTVYDFELSAVAQSDIWDSETGKLEVCHRLEMTLVDPYQTGDDSNVMVPAQGEEDIEIAINLIAGFNVTEGLAAGVTSNVTKAVDFESAVIGFKCKENATSAFAADTSVLAPNEELKICVISTDGNIELKQLVAMNAQQTSTVVPIVSNGVADVGAITSVDDRDDDVALFTNGIIVTTRLPLNAINFADGQEVTISGSVLLQLVGRRLQGDRKLRALAVEDSVNDDGPQEIGYQVNVGLKGEDGSAPGDAIPMGSSAGCATSKFAVAFGMISSVALRLM